MKPQNHARKNKRIFVAALMTAIAVQGVNAQGPRPGGGTGNGPGADDNRQRQAAPIPQARRGQRNPVDRPDDNRAPIRIDRPGEVRTVDGSGNNQANPDWGAAEHPFRRAMRARYANGTDVPSGPNRPSARAISNALCAQTELIPNAKGATDFLWQWGQFLDHDIDETPSADPAEAFDIEVPAGDPWFDPTNSGSATIPLNRSGFDTVRGVRQQVNAISAYIDASNVYGSEDERAFALRTLDGTGKLKVTESDVGDLLPYNADGLPNAPTAFAPNFFLAGDVRANEQIALIAMHTLFVREHNHWAEAYARINRRARGEEIYQFARMMVAAEMQAITYNEFLPVLLGEDALPPYAGYRPNVDASIANSFATSAYRLGHSLLSPTLLRVNRDGSEADEGHIALASAFFVPSEIEDHGIDTVLRGLANQVCQELDGQLVDDLRNFLFGPPGSGGFDLASLNIQRGRDHGLPGLNAARRELGLRPARRFDDINSDPDLVAGMRSVYRDPDQVDLWIGGLCEEKVPNSMLGPVFHRMIVDQFRRLRDGDRFWYENYLGEELVEIVNEQTLAVILRRNTSLGREIQDNVFLINLNDAPPAGPGGGNQNGGGERPPRNGGGRPGGR